MMRRFSPELWFLGAVLAAAPALAQQAPAPAPAIAPGQAPDGLPGLHTPPPSSRVARQGSNFDRVSTSRREVRVGRARAGRGMPAAGPALSLGQAQAAERPLSLQSRTSPHTFYPGMRASQSPNLNVPIYRSRSPRMGRFMYPGMNMYSGLGGTAPARAPGRISR